MIDYEWMRWLTTRECVLLHWITLRYASEVDGLRRKAHKRKRAKDANFVIYQEAMD